MRVFVVAVASVGAARACLRGHVSRDGTETLLITSTSLDGSRPVRVGYADPFLTFEEAPIPPQIMACIKQAGFSLPSVVQSQTWPAALQGRDCVGVAKTGSGKTLGFLFPGFQHIQQSRKDPRQGPIILVLAPTRELATQIHDETVKFGRTSNVNSTCVYGGAPKGPQLRDLRYGAHVVIATPGRLNDFLEAGQINLGQVSYLVFDEADRMLDMGCHPAPLRARRVHARAASGV